MSAIVKYCVIEKTKVLFIEKRFETKRKEEKERKKFLRTGGKAQWLSSRVEHMLSMHNALGSNSSTTNTI